MAPATVDSWACRKPQLSALRGLLWSSCGRCIFACGSSSTGKRTIVNEAIDSVDGRIKVEVDCVISHTERLLFSAICGRSITGDMNELVRELNVDANNTNTGGGMVVVLNRAERLVSGRSPLNFSALTALLSLPRRVENSSFSLVFISRLPWPRFRDAAGLDCPPPACVHFPSYSSKQLSAALTFMHTGRMVPEGSGMDVEAIGGIDVDSLYPAFVGMLTDLLSTVTTDLRELHSIAREMFPRYLAPLLQKEGANKPKSAHLPLALFNTVTAELRTVLKSMHHREYVVHDGNIVPRMDIIPAAAAGRRMAAKKKVRALVPDEEDLGYASDAINALNDDINIKVDEDLSEVSRFLLLAAFLAGRNPPKHDMRYFTSERTRRPYKRAKQSKKKAATGNNATQPFSVERLMAIFEALREANREVVDLRECAGNSLGTAGVVQISNLISLGYLCSDATSGDPLADRKFKARVPQALAEALARSLRVELHHYLHVD